MKHITTILLILLPATLVSCQKAETKDEEMTRMLIGTWVKEDIFLQIRETYKADGTCIFQKLGTSDTGKGKAPFERRIRHAARKLDGGAWYWSKNAPGGTRWWIKPGFPRWRCARDHRGAFTVIVSDTAR